ncbi:hypothetical protein LEP1GSC052_1957 [Leptospira kmetyi serovar Malaysia str. Bejo-Iso9]|nr:hypothetical protein LEP1GSC052_1957 [Leptospira kmetyi serovar Malaysia str. Bejo-Iso9]
MGFPDLFRFESRVVRTMKPISLNKNGNSSFKKLRSGQEIG